MNAGMIVGTILLAVSLAGLGWQGYDFWLALKETALKAAEVGW